MAVDRSLHKYTLGEELISSISHLIGFILALIATIYACIIAYNKDTLTFVSIIIFGVSMLILYGGSTVYHALKPSASKKVFRILDHCFVFILIIGTYAPYTLIAMKGVFGTTLFAVNMIVGTIGIILTAIDMKRFAKFSMICYIAMGWVIVFAIKPLIDSLPTSSLILLFGGGVFYTVGAVIYLLGKKLRYAHSIWHFFVLGGTIFHFYSILYGILI